MVNCIPKMTKYVLKYKFIIIQNYFLNNKCHIFQWDEFMVLLQIFRLHDRPDRLGWLGNVFDVFSVSSTRSYIDSSMLDIYGA